MNTYGNLLFFLPAADCTQSAGSVRRHSGKLWCWSVSCP